jgi:hypothetical protein
MALAKARRLALLLLAAVLLAVGVSISPHAVVSAPSETKDVTVTPSAAISAVPPGRVVGRPVATPAVVKVHSPAELIALSPSEPVFGQLGGLTEDITPATRSARLPATGTRAPPV